MSKASELPCLVVSDRFNRSRAELVMVVPITRTDRGLPSHSKQRLQRKWGRVAAQTMMPWRTEWDSCWTC